MDALHAAVLASHRDHSSDLAFSALPHAPKQPPREPGPVRRALGWGLLQAAYRLEPATRQQRAEAPRLALSTPARGR